MSKFMSHCDKFLDCKDRKIIVTNKELSKFTSHSDTFLDKKAVSLPKRKENCRNLCHKVTLF